MNLTCEDCGRAFQQERGRPAPRCDECKLERKKLTDAKKALRWRENDPDHARALRRASYHRTKGSDRQQAYRLAAQLKQYGLTPVEHAAMRTAQNDRCAICGEEHRGRGKRLHIDHDHVTGKVRALLCGHCNALLGQANDDPAVLRAAAEYIERHRA